jgi:trimeric autotransporter adhesin
LRFSSSWFGPKNIYLLASESSTLNTGWVQVGTWVVTGGAPTADSVSPSPGSGSSPVFTFTVSDSSLQSNISGIAALITTGAPTNLTNACYLVYTRGNTTNSTIGLYDNNAAVLASKGLGSSTTMQNTQCAVGYTAVTTSGNSVMLQVQLVFGNFSGPKTIYLQAVEPGANSGWVQRGTWTVP